MSKTPPIAAFAVTPQRDEQELLNVGQQCSKKSPDCGVVDFLPYKCDYCEEKFCSDHRFPDSHDCEKWDPNAVDRRALQCQLCSELVAVPPGMDPNDKMNQHLDRDCSVATGKRTKTTSAPKCNWGRCEKLMWQPIECDKCHKQFCASHRYAPDHACPSLKATSAPTLPAHSSAKGAAALASFKRNMANSKFGSKSASKPVARGPAQRAPARPTVSSSASGGASSSLAKPAAKEETPTPAATQSVSDKVKAAFSSTDRCVSPPRTPVEDSSERTGSTPRPSPVPSMNPSPNLSAGTPPPKHAASNCGSEQTPAFSTRSRVLEERKSQYHAMLERDRKGLLNEREKETLEEARKYLKERKSSDCIIM